MNAGKSRGGFPRPRSLTARLTLTFVAAGLALTVASAFVTERFFRAQLETQASASLAHHARQLALKLSRDLAERVDDLQRIAASELLRSTERTVEARRKFLEDAQEVYGLAWLGLTDNSGRVIAATGGHLEGESVERTSWFLDGRTGLHLGPDMAQPELAGATEEDARFTAMSLPVKNAAGLLLGVLGAQHYLHYSPQTSPLPTGANQDGLTADVYSDGLRRWLLGSGGGDGKTALPAPVTLGRVRGGRESFDGVEYFMGFARTGAYREVRGPGWLVAVRQPTEKVFAPAALLRGQILGWGAGLTLFFAIPVALSSRTLGRKLRSVTASAKCIRSGEVLAVMPVFSGQDDLAKMSAEVSELVEGLRARAAAPNLAHPESRASAATDATPAEYIRPTGTDPRRVVW